MPELSLGDRLQPSLLDRLTDEHPSEPREARNERVLSVKRLRECVRRDLAWLLNTTDLETVQDLTGYRQVKDSVLNFGVPELTGRTVSGLPIEEVSEMIRRAVIRFEPRILKHTLTVRGVKLEEEIAAHALSFEITGQLWAQPMPQELYLRTELDLELGDVKVTER